jgi:hypothetical protein
MSKIKCSEIVAYIILSVNCRATVKNKLGLMWRMRLMASLTIQCFPLLSSFTSCGIWIYWYALSLCAHGNNQWPPRQVIHTSFILSNRMALLYVIV